MIDLSHKVCIADDCKERAYFNYETETKQLYCVKHKTSEMTLVYR